MRRTAPAAIAVALVATLSAGIATAASKSAGYANACVGKHHALRLLSGSKCPAADKPIQLGARAPLPEDFVSEAGGQTDLPLTGSTEKAVLAVDLPAGSWVLTTRLTAVNFGAADYIRCELADSTGQIAGGSASAGGAIPAANLGLIGAVTLTKKDQVDVECSHDATVASDPPYIDPGAVVDARPVGSLSDQTH